MDKTTATSKLGAFVSDLLTGAETYTPWVRLDFSVGNFRVKTAESMEELKAAFELRHEVFFERGLGRKLPNGLDVDEYDIDSDCLLVIDKASGKIVGNYRIRCSGFQRGFYSEGEFILDEFLVHRSWEKLEIGRACVHPEYRKGSVIQLLWRGLIDYAKQVEARYIFGCSSVSARVPGQVEAVWRYLVDHWKLSDQFSAIPRNPYPMRSEPVKDFELPSLLASYLKSGAKVLGAPAYDPEFECADFLTVLDIRDLASDRCRKFLATKIQPETERAPLLTPVSHCP